MCFGGLFWLFFWFFVLFFGGFVLVLLFGCFGRCFGEVASLLVQSPRTPRGKNMVKTISLQQGRVLKVGERLRVIFENPSH